MQRHVSNNRLLSLANLLRGLPRQRFDYSHWVGDEWKGDNLVSCGTSACALGWATTIPSLRRAGLILKKFKYDDGGFVALKHNEFAGPFEAAAEVFGITDDEAHDLFMPQNSAEEKATAKQVAKKIERFVTERK